MIAKDLKVSITGEGMLIGEEDTEVRRIHPRSDGLDTEQSLGVRPGILLLRGDKDT